MEKSAEPVGLLEEQAHKRKLRLKQMRRKLEPADEEGINLSETDESLEKKINPEKRPRFRCYRPADEGLKSAILPDTEPANIEDEVQEQLASAHTQLPIDELDITNLAPRKPDWDLKRDCAKKLEKLDVLTKQAISGLIRDRLRESMGQRELQESAERNGVDVA